MALISTMLKLIIFCITAIEPNPGKKIFLIKQISAGKTVCGNQRKSGRQSLLVKP